MTYSLIGVTTNQFPQYMKFVWHQNSLFYCYHVHQVINNWWRRDQNGNPRTEMKSPPRNWYLWRILCWFELVWHGFDNMSLLHEYLINGLSMNANDIRFMSHNLHNVTLSRKIGKTCILIRSWVRASFLFYNSLTFFINI